MPQSWFHPKSPKSIFDLDALFREQDAAGVDITVFGNNWIRSPDGADPLRVVQEFNTHAAELTTKHPKRLVGLACSVPYDNDKILKETEKAIREYRLKGIMIGSSTNGEYLDSPRATPFFELVSDLDVPLFVHPPNVTTAPLRVFNLVRTAGLAPTTAALAVTMQLISFGAILVFFKVFGTRYLKGTYLI